MIIIEKGNKYFRGRTDKTWLAEFSHSHKEKLKLLLNFGHHNNGDNIRDIKKTNLISDMVSF